MGASWALGLSDARLSQPPAAPAKAPEEGVGREDGSKTAIRTPFPCSKLAIFFLVLVM